jgi:hypothetical protein
MRGLPANSSVSTWSQHGDAVTEEQKLKFIDIRQRSITGKGISGEEMKFCGRMREEHPSASRRLDEYIRQWTNSYVSPWLPEPEIPDV